MFDKFDWMEGRYEELAIAVSQPEIIADQTKWQKLLKEHASLEPAVTAYRAYRKTLAEIADAKEMLAQPDLAELAQAELDELTADKARQEEALRILLLPKDPDDDRSVVMEIRAGAGGEEAALFAGEIVRMYTRYAEKRGFRVTMVNLSDTELGGVKEAVFTISGTGAFHRLKYESGVHCVKRIPVTESNGKLQTSTCTVAVLPEAEDVELTIDPGELRIDTYRAGGAGGQHVNRTDSAVRITHLPTGIVAQCQNERSQIQNREVAMRILKSRLYDRLRSEKDSAYAQNRRVQIGTGDRSERVRTYHYMQNRVTDHRIGLTLYNRIDDILGGAIDDFIDALLMAEQAAKLREAGAPSLPM